MAHMYRRNFNYCISYQQYASIDSKCSHAPKPTSSQCRHAQRSFIHPPLLGFSAFFVISKQPSRPYVDAASVYCNTLVCSQSAIRVERSLARGGS